jgi:hypothetical protein
MITFMPTNIYIIVIIYCTLYNGELLFDNQDLCLILRVSRRTLQRYRTSGVLPYKQTDQKIYYLESDVRKFVEEHLQKPKVLDQRDKTL